MMSSWKFGGLSGIQKSRFKARSVLVLGNLRLLCLQAKALALDEGADCKLLSAGFGRGKDSQHQGLT